MTDFVGAKVVAHVFLATAAVILVASSLLLAVHIFSHGRLDHPSSMNVKAVVVAGTMLGSILAASWVAFFGYVVQLLVAVHLGVRQLSDDLSELELSVPSED